jgi:hypothetical protein
LNTIGLGTARAMVATACMVLTMTVGCNSHTATKPPSDPGQRVELLLPKLIAAGLGTACELDGKQSAVSFSAHDIGATGVPPLSMEERSLIEKISKYVPEKTLRFAYLGSELLIFDAVAGPCAAQAPGYFVLNGACNEYYTPPLDIQNTHSEPDCLYPPRPWVAGDRGRGTWAWTHYVQMEAPNSGPSRSPQ